ncbi:tRNA epoxyqueuosine(34) reductase QueG [Bacteroides faecalis]|uniref:tRNA epoxyqueuosine(34) reductase QueG n=1 Tax=Bacteroides faecalis TaxID=2447885 RepID=A0A401LW55_9BACE|nr:tRNA epoxyqueuosine(34) reductase QueG [Bacteroides faecalis]GCB35741.1 tRNA epoxyqueuosine(34) reductase QueG [Bacteroides faecalis]
MNKLLSSEQIKAEATRLGFSACGLAPAEAVNETVATSFRQWLADGCQAEMAYMQNYEDKRLDPRLLVEGARTVISVALNYYPDTKLPIEEYQIAWYAYGKDYHDVMKKKLNALLEFIILPSTSAETIAPATSPLTVSGRVFCDTAPILERYWAWRAGLGWIGKNTQLIIPHAGSCFFLGEVIINIAADNYDIPQKSRCGSCTRCIDTCPTKALEAPFRLNSKRCLSYLTIEYRGDLSPNMGQKMNKKIYGCDECQHACPWNRYSTPCKTEEFHPSPSLLQMKKSDWQSLTEEQYKTLFKGSAVKRVKYSGLMRNIRIVKESPESK